MKTIKLNIKRSTGRQDKPTVKKSFSFDRYQDKTKQAPTMPSGMDLPNKSPNVAFDKMQFEIQVMRESYAAFVKKFWKTIVQEPLVWNWHMDEICSRIATAFYRVINNLPCEKDLLINISPGTSKSLLTSVMAPAWAWTIMPTLKFICASYSDDLALELAGRCRDLITSDLYKQYYPHIELKKDDNKKTQFANTLGGKRRCSGVTGTVTGFHAHIIIVDDPINPKSADRAKELETANKFMSKTLPSRMVNKETTLTVLVMQRLHQDDPSSRMMKEGRCRKLIIPATDEYPIHPPKLKQYYKNGLMDPKRMSRRYLDRMCKDEAMGRYAFAGQYGQQPAPPEGGMFLIDKFRQDWDHPAMQLPIVEACRFWDKAGTIAGGAYTVGCLMTKRGNEKDGYFFAIEDVIRVQLDSYARNTLIEQTAADDGLDVIIGFEQEGGSGGKESLETSFRRLDGYRVKKLRPIRDKEMRADAYSSQVNGGNVWLAKRSWVNDFKEEHKYFPFSTYKDQVDAAAHAFTLISNRRTKVVGGFGHFNKHPSRHLIK